MGNLSTSQFCFAKLPHLAQTGKRALTAKWKEHGYACLELLAVLVYLNALEESNTRKQSLVVYYFMFYMEMNPCNESFPHILVLKAFHHHHHHHHRRRQQKQQRQHNYHHNYSQAFLYVATMWYKLL